MATGKRSSTLREATSAAQLAKYPPEISEFYSIKDTIGAGGFAKVKLARHKMTEEKVAIKIMDKETLRKTNDLPRVALEIQALRELRHQNIARLYEVVETEDRYFLVMEYAPGGELFDYIVARERLKEDEARVFFRQIAAAVAYCHSKGIAHRDLKPENLLLDASQNIKLIDFGLIAHPPDIHTTRLHTCCGSAAYAAPELIRGDPYLGEPADVWSLGILLYALLCGFLPFDDENVQRLYRLIQRGQYEIPTWLTPESERFIGSLLQHKPENRLTMDQLLSHPWMIKGMPPTVAKVPWASNCEGEALEPAVLTEMAKFHGTDVTSITESVRAQRFDQIYASYELLCVRRAKGRGIRLQPSRAISSGSKAMLLLSTKSGVDADRLSSGGLSGSMPSLGNSGVLSGTTSASFEDVTTRTDTGLAPLTDKQRWASQQVMAETTSNDSTSLSRNGRTTSHPDLLSPSKLAPPVTLAPPPVPPPQPARKGFGGSLRSLASSIRSLFGSRANVDEPRQVKGLYNMSTTSIKSPEEVRDEVLRVLRENRIEVREKGFVIKGRIFDEAGKDRILFNMEVCRVPRMELTGIKLTRLKGDTWAYKKVCQDLVSQMRL